MRIDAHRCTQVHIDAHMYTDAHRYTQMHRDTDAQRCIQIHTDAHGCMQICTDNGCNHLLEPTQDLEQCRLVFPPAFSPLRVSQKSPLL